MKKEEFNVEDVYDGIANKNTTVTNHPTNITFQVNIDRVALFHSSKYSIWPIYLKINELPPKYR